MHPLEIYRGAARVPLIRSLSLSRKKKSERSITQIYNIMAVESKGEPGQGEKKRIPPRQIRVKEPFGTLTCEERERAHYERRVQHP